MTDRNQPETFLDRETNPLFGGFKNSPLVEATITKVHTDEANNVTFTVDLVTIKNETKNRVPLLFPYASVDGSGGIFAVPNVGDMCLVALAAGNQAYVIGYHSATQVSQGRASATTGGAALKGGFSQSQLIPGSVVMQSPYGNRVLVHPGGSISIDARKDLFSFYDAVSSTIENLSRSRKDFTAGGSVVWKEGAEKSKRSMDFSATMFTKSATKENLDAGDLRGGARMQILFGELAQWFLLSIDDDKGIKSKISVGPNGIILTSGNGTTQGSISISPTGNFSLIAGDPLGPHTELDIAKDQIAIAAFIGTSPIANVQCDTQGNVKISSDQKITVQAPKVEVDGEVDLGGLGGLGVVRPFIDEIMVIDPQGGTAKGFATGGSALVKAAG